MTEAQTASTPALDQAVVLAKSQFEGWLKDNLDRDLNGRQRELLARVALEVMYPLMKIALFHELADSLEETGLFEPGLISAIRSGAEVEMEVKTRGRARD